MFGFRPKNSVKPAKNISLEKVLFSLVNLDIE